MMVKGYLPDVKKASKKLMQGLMQPIANKAKNHFVSGFKSGGRRTDNSRSGWKVRKRHDNGRAILVKTGALRADINVRAVSMNYAIIGTSSSTSNYASVHNFGTKIMPQREFLGKSRTLDKKITTFVIKKMNKVYKK